MDLQIASVWGCPDASRGNLRWFAVVCGFPLRENASAKYVFLTYEPTWGRSEANLHAIRLDNAKWPQNGLKWTQKAPSMDLKWAPIAYKSIRSEAKFAFDPN